MGDAGRYISRPLQYHVIKCYSGENIENSRSRWWATTQSWRAQSSFPERYDGTGGLSEMWLFETAVKRKTGPGRGNHICKGAELREIMLCARKQKDSVAGGDCTALWGSKQRWVVKSVSSARNGAQKAMKKWYDVSSKETLEKPATSLLFTYHPTVFPLLYFLFSFLCPSVGTLKEWTLQLPWQKAFCTSMRIFLRCLYSPMTMSKIE